MKCHTPAGRADPVAHVVCLAVMSITPELWWLLALSAAGALLLWVYLQIALSAFRAPELTPRARWVGLVVPGAALVLAIQTGRPKRVLLFAFLLGGYVALRVAAP